MLNGMHTVGENNGEECKVCGPLAEVILWLVPVGVKCLSFKRKIGSDNKTPDLPMTMINIAHSNYHLISRQVTLAKIFKLNQVLKVFQVF